MFFGYNGDGLRVWKQVGTNPSSRVYYLYDGSQPVVELDSTGTVLKAANTFGANGLLSRNVGGTSSGSSFYTFDPQGSVCQRFGSSANLLSSDQYDAFGLLQATTQSGAADVFGFGAQWGYQTDAETGLLLLTNRYYDPGLGRFLTRDPIGQAGGLNLYQYVGNGPASFADPLGFISKEDVFIGGAALLGGAGGAWACLGNPICIVAGAALGAATARYELGHHAAAAVDTGIQTAALVATVGCLTTALPSVPNGSEEDEQLIDVYRGVAADHPGYYDALEGNAYPRGGPAGPLEHVLGDTRSPFTSWTLDLSKAQDFAGDDGVVLYDRVPASDLIQAPRFYLDEYEVLRRGPVEGAQVLDW